MTIKVVEKKNPHAVHAHCCTMESAQRWIDNIKSELANGVNHFMDKTLTANSFTIK